MDTRENKELKNFLNNQKKEDAKENNERFELQKLLNDRENDENILFSGTLCNLQYNLDIPVEVRIIALIDEHFKFGYGGYNGWYENRKELIELIKKEIQGA